MIHTSISDSGSIPLSSIHGAAMASTGYQASDWSLLGQSKTITANNIVSFSRQTAPVAAWFFKRDGVRSALLPNWSTRPARASPSFQQNESHNLLKKQNKSWRQKRGQNLYIKSFSKSGDKTGDKIEYFSLNKFQYDSILTVRWKTKLSIYREIQER